MSVVDFPQAGSVGTSQRPKRYDIEVYQGDTFAFDLVLLDSLNAAVDITGWSAIAQIKEIDTNNAAPTPAFDVTLTPAEGRISIGLSDIASGALPAREYKYDVQIADTSGNKRTYIGGKLTITEDVSE